MLLNEEEFMESLSPFIVSVSEGIFREYQILKFLNSQTVNF